VEKMEFMLDGIIGMNSIVDKNFDWGEISIEIFVKN